MTDNTAGFFEAQKYDFSDTSFNLLMQNRIHKVLLICSNYDAFMLEEDGRIDEQIFNEYVSLSLRYPPVFMQVNSASQALKVLQEEKIDLIISMLSTGEIDTFELANKIKEKYPRIPIVVLTYFSREVSMKLEKENLSSIDYVFCWLGNADLLLVIIKLIEDRMNADHDIEQIGVQAILLVEDNIRYISAYLPTLYRIVLFQSREYQTEALNEHQRMLRMRGRPKILLAKNYEEAVELYEKFKYNLLGVISDISFEREGKKDSEAGIKLCQRIKNDDEHMPYLLQSSDISQKAVTEQLKAGFMHKYSKTLSIELRNYFITQLAFGPFIFRNPSDMSEIGRANDLQSFQHMIATIPDETLEYHTNRNHFSKWLNARALFPIAQMFKFISRDDFPSLNDLRRFVIQAISSFRHGKGRGIIAEFDKANFDEYLFFSRIGQGSIGGKARGLAFVNSLLKANNVIYKFKDVMVTVPRTVVLGTDIFDEFMEMNDLYKISLSDLPDEEILKHFLKAQLPGSVYQDLYAILSVIKNPIAIRSSSKLEDSHYQPFAGIYSTYMLPPVDDSAVMVKNLSDAIKEVYASVYYRESKAYMTATSNVIDEEKMGIVLQEVCGKRYGNRFYPTLSGVARSINFYPIEPEKPADGIVNIAYGLGKLIVDGGTSLRFSPKYPQKILQLSDPAMAMRDTQKTFYALDMSMDSFVPSTDDGVNILKLNIREAEKDSAFRYAASTYDYENHIIRDGIYEGGKKLVTFSSILKHKMFPVAEILEYLLEVGEKEMNNPIEIEFAANLDTPEGIPKIFNFLQIRPIVVNEQTGQFKIDEVPRERTIVFSEMALGNGVIANIRDFIYVKPESFNAAKSELIATRVDKLNAQCLKENRSFVLVGPGRWGSTDPWLGIPIKWAQISAARVIVESGLKNYRIDPSQGTHFFQNLTSFRVGYFTINPYINDGYYNLDYLAQCPTFYEDEYLRHLRFEQPLKIQIDGKHKKGIIIMPEGA
jgi:CheY-like chemotaxis protein